MYSVSLEGNSAILFIFGIFAIPIFIRYGVRYLNYRRHFSAIKKRNLVVTEYKVPLDIPPAFMGAIIDNRISVNDFVAATVGLYAGGFLQINYIQKEDDYLLTTTSKDRNGLYEHQLFILETIDFKAGDMWANYYAKDLLTKIQLYNFMLLKDLQKSGYYFFHKNIMEMSYINYYNGVILRGIGKGLIKPWNWPGFLFGILFLPFGFFWIVVALLYYAAIGIFKNKTDKWEEIWPDVAGYYNYLKVVESEKRKYELDRQGKDMRVSDHDAYLTATGLLDNWIKALNPNKASQELYEEYEERFNLNNR